MLGSSEVGTPEELEANYSRGRFGARLGAGARPALLLVDLCQAYTEPGSALHAGDGAHRAVAACRELLDGARSAGRPVLHTRIVLRAPSDGGLFVRKVPALDVFRAPGPLADPPPGLEPLPGEVVISKEFASAFFGTTLAATLTYLGVDTLVVGGLSTSGCVRASAVDAMQHGFIPLVVREACGDRHPAPHEAALFDLDNKYADVVLLAEALEILEGSA
jgi:maleamate amidohydrolase